MNKNSEDLTMHGGEQRQDLSMGLPWNWEVGGKQEEFTDDVETGT